MNFENPSQEILNKDILKRDQYITPLNKIIESSNEPLVILLNNKWGEGKTTFVKRWISKISSSSGNLIAHYINIWESDYSRSPLLNIISELQNIAFEKELKLDKSITQGIKLLQKTTPHLLRLIFEKYTGLNVDRDLLSSLSDFSFEFAKEEFEEFKKGKQDISNFKLTLEAEISKTDRKIVIFIDELDRCKPDYALETLEVLKHFFEIKNLTFVLSVDKIQLQKTISHFYGGSDFNSSEYLSKFFNIEFSIPRPNSKQYSYFLQDILGLVHSLEGEHPYTLRDFREITNAIIESQNLSLRQQQKIYIHIKFALPTIPRFFENCRLVVFMIFLKLSFPDIYDRIVNKRIAKSDISESVLKDLFFTYDNSVGHYKLEIDLFIAYDNYISSDGQANKEKFFTQENNPIYNSSLKNTKWLQNWRELNEYVYYLNLKNIFTYLELI